MDEFLIVLLVAITVVAILLAFVRPMGRLVFFLLGLVPFLLVFFEPIQFRSLHGEHIVLAIPGLALCVAVVAAELGTRIAKRL